MRRAMKIVAYWLVSLWPVLGLSGALSGGGRLEVRVVDDQTGDPISARVALTNAEGRFIEIEGNHGHVQYLDKRWCYVNGGFNAVIPGSGAGLEIRRGLEVRPLFAELTAPRGGAKPPRVFRLRRWIDMRQQGYWNGDLHAHVPAPAETYAQMQAEDLNTVSLLCLASPVFNSPVNEFFTGKLDARSTPGREIFVGQEVQDFQMGHLTLLNLTHLVSGYPDMGGGLEYWRSQPHWDMVRAMRATREQNGIVFWSHLCSLPGAQSPIGIALGLVDGIELITWNDPTQLPNHWSPWQNSGMSQAEFPVMRAVDLYYQYLNAGFRVPIAAGTDKLDESIPLGSNRTYARVKEPAGYASWLAGVKAGNGFVSNGPILEFDAGEKTPGEVVEFEGPRRITARATARSILPFTTLEIVVNGQTVAHKTVPSFKNPAVDGVYSMEVETTVELTRSAWLAARVVEHPDLKNPILPRGLSVFAHSNPIYFLDRGHKVREGASIAYLEKYVKGVLHWLDTKPPFANEEDRRNAQRDAEQALRVYEQL
jgi:hypothetical protein